PARPPRLAGGAADFAGHGEYDHRGRTAVAAAKCFARHVRHRAHGRRGPRARRDDGNSVRSVPVRRGSRTAIFQNAALGDAVDLGRGDFELARGGAVDFASVAKNPKLWLLAHRPDGGADDVVRPHLRPVRLACETLLALDADKIPADMAGRPAGE